MTAVQAQITANTSSDRTAVTNDQMALDTATKNLSAVQTQVAQNVAGDRTALQNAQQAAANSQKALSGAQATVQASQGTTAQQIAAAKSSLYTAQVSRDGACGQNTTNTQCKAGDAAVSAAQTGIDQATAAAQAAVAQGQQAIATAQSQLDQANGALKTAEDTLNTHLATYQGNVVTANGQVAQAQGAQQAAQDAQAANATQAQQMLAQSRQAVDQAGAALGTAQTSYDQMAATTAANLQAAQGQVAQAQAAVQSAQANAQQVATPPTPADLAVVQAQVDQARAALGTTQDHLTAATLLAPFAGTVAQVNDTPGALVGGGSAGTSSSTNSSTSSTAFIVLTDLSALQVVAQVNEADLAAVKLGEPVQFTLNAIPGHTFSGKVAAIQPLGTASNNVVTYNVTCTIDATQTKLLPGMTANVTIVTRHETNAVQVPAAALAFAQSPTAASLPSSGQAVSGANAQVLILQNGHAVRQPVHTGLSDGSHTEVLAGLNDGQQVVTGAASGG